MLRHCGKRQHTLVSKLCDGNLQHVFHGPQSQINDNSIPLLTCCMQLTTLLLAADGPQHHTPSCMWSRLRWQMNSQHSNCWRCCHNMGRTRYTGPRSKWRCWVAAWYLARNIRSVEVPGVREGSGLGFQGCRVSVCSGSELAWIWFVKHINADGKCHATVDACTLGVACVL